MSMSVEAAGPRTAYRTFAAARDRLFALQSSRGWCKGELQTNATRDAKNLSSLDSKIVLAAAVWIHSQRPQNGDWATFCGGPGKTLAFAGTRPQDADGSLERTFLKQG